MVIRHWHVKLRSRPELAGSPMRVPVSDLLSAARHHRQSQAEDERQMTRKERVRQAITHHDTDIVPYSIGLTQNAYQRLLDYIVPDFVHVLYDGVIVKSGGKELALELEEKGYDWIKKEAVEA